MKTEERISTVERDGLMFDVLDDGPYDGEPVVLLHGWPERATRLAARRADPQRGRLPDAGDGPARLRARRPPEAAPRLPAADLAADVAALIDEVGGSAHVVGHDWGAAAAWTVAGLHPDQVRTLTAVSVPHPAAFMKSMVKSDQLLKSYYMALFQLPFLPGADRATSARPGSTSSCSRAA